MKQEKGITLISVTVYIIGMTIAIATITVLSSYFYKNVNKTTRDIDSFSEFTQFNTFFLEEINHKNNKVVECGSNYIIFSNGVQYSFVKGNMGIYRDKIKICRYVENCSFNYTTENNKGIVTVSMKIKNGEPKTMDYTMNNI